MKQNAKFFRVIAAILVLALTLPLFTVAFAASYPYDTVSMDDVNLRKSARSTASLVARIAYGDKITVLGASGSYYKVRFNGKTGYAQKSFVDGTDASPDKALDVKTRQQLLTGIISYPYETEVIFRVKLRKTADQNGTVIKTLTEGTAVTVTARTSNGFVKVKAAGKTGYIAETHINIANIPAPTPAPTAMPVPGAEKYVKMQKGDAGENVKILQTTLAELGYMTKDDIDGKFGAKTESAMKTFQKRNGLKTDGIASPELQVTMYEGTPKDYKGYRQVVKTLPSVSGAVIRIGSKGTAIRKIQLRLKSLGYYDGDLTEKCDNATVDAIKLFEGRNGFTADGELTQEEQDLLFSGDVLEVSATPTPVPTMVPQYSRTMKRGAEGEDVITLQERLQELGYLEKITGKYDDATIDAVKNLQAKHALTADGIVGPITHTVIFGQNAVNAKDVSPAQPDELDNIEITPDNVVVIRAGSAGAAVLRLQVRLQELGYYISRQDGYYLTEDISAVRAFQKLNGLTMDGVAGYDTQSLLFSNDALAGNAVAATTVPVLRYGSQGNEVSNMQNRLIALGYLTGKADGVFGTATKDAVKAFQKANKLTVDGVAGESTLNAMNAYTAVASAVSTSDTLRLGMISETVRDMQTRLITLGYLSGKADGIFGSKTSLALIAFQKANKLTVDGVAGTKTLTKLNSKNAVTANGKTSAEAAVPNAPAITSTSAAQVRYAYWYSEMRAKAKTMPNVTVYDFTTGISWKLNMFSFGAHADCEPMSAEDTANMNRAFGGKTTWTPKAVWVYFPDGSVYIASTHNTPHGVQHNKTNNFSGHLCLHFPRTQSQVASIGDYATSHQRAVDLAWEATLKKAGKK